MWPPAWVFILRARSNLPLILTNAAFMKLHQVFVFSYAIGWLVKLTIVALAVGWFLR